MNFGLLLSTFPRVEESRPHYDAMLALDARRVACAPAEPPGVADPLTDRAEHASACARTAAVKPPFRAHAKVTRSPDNP